MENRISTLEVRVKVLEKTKEEFYEMKNSITRMEMVDKNIFEKLEMINDNIKTHKETFESHDNKEMEKYQAIDNRLQRLEKIMYMTMGAGILIELMSKWHLITLFNK